MSKSVFRQLTTLLVLSFALFLTIINTPLIMAQAQPAEATLPTLPEGGGQRLLQAQRTYPSAKAGSQAALVQPTSFPALDFTAVATNYLPIIVRSPQPANPVPAGCNPTKGSGGLKPGTYHTTVAGLTAVVVVGRGYNANTPTYLGFTIHGDGGAYEMIQRGNNPLNELADEWGWILVSPLAPNGKSWWSNPTGDHKQALANVLEEMFAKYNLCRGIVFGTTGSGGSEFWTSQFFPEKGGQYPAHMVIACGGSGGSSSKINALGKNPNVVARSRLYYVYGTEDRLASTIRRSIQTYTGAGFHVQVKVLEGAGHCNRWRQQDLPAWHDWAATYWTEIANLLRVS
jgi:hypothetical protein